MHKSRVGGDIHIVEKWGDNMSFQIWLQKNTSPPNKVDKNVENILEANGVLKDGCSIIDPVILIDTTLSDNMLADINYVYVETFGRYYYVTNIVLEHTTLYSVHCHVDVLMSFKDEMLENSGVIARQENAYNLYLDDGWFMAYQNPRIQTKLFSVEAPFETQEFVLVVAGS